jgi:hypothetical protein
MISNFTLDITINDLSDNLPHEKIIKAGYVYSNLTFFKTKLISHRDFYVETEKNKYAILSYTDFNTLTNNGKISNVINYVKCCKFPFYSKWYYEFGKLKKVNKLFYLDNVYEIYKDILSKNYNLFVANCQHRCKIIIKMLCE